MNVAMKSDVSDDSPATVPTVGVTPLALTTESDGEIGATGASVGVGFTVATVAGLIGAGNRSTGRGGVNGVATTGARGAATGTGRVMPPIIPDEP